MQKQYPLHRLLLEMLVLLCCAVSAQAIELEAAENHLFDPIYSVTKHSSDTYDLTVAISVNSLQDGMILKAVCGNLVQEQRNVISGQYTFVFSGMTDHLSVNLSLWGKADTSQEALSCFDEINVTDDRILNVYDDSTNKSRPSVYDLYKVSDYTLTTEQFDLEALQKYKRRDNLIATIMTDDSGTTSYNFTQNKQSEGTYLIIEQISLNEKMQKGLFFTIPFETEDPQTNQHTLYLTAHDFQTIDYDLSAAEYIVLPDTGSFGVKKIKGLGMMIIFSAVTLMLSNWRKKV